MHFLVRSISNDGKSTIGFMEADDYVQLLDILDNQNIAPLNITAMPRVLSPFIPKRGAKISSDEVIEMMENLHLVIKSGLPLYQGVLDLAEDSDNKRFKSMLLQIANSVSKGRSLSEAFEPYKSVVGVMILNLIKIGEETGQLEVTLQRAAIFLKKTMALKKKAKSALIYPSFAFLAVMGAMLVWMIYVLPQMTELFKEMDVVLPPLTVAMMSISDFLAAYIVHLLVGIVVLVMLFKLSHKKFKKVRWYTDKLILKIPIIKHIVSGFNIAFISEYLRLALISGVPIFTAMDTLKRNLANELYQEALRDSTEDVLKGSQLSTAFAKTEMFTPFMIRMMSVGESAGTLESQLDLIAEHYYEKVDYYAGNIGKVIEPVVLIVVGGFMALVMVGLMGPMYDLVAGLD